MRARSEEGSSTLVLGYPPFLSQVGDIFYGFLSSELRHDLRSDDSHAGTTQVQEMKGDLGQAQSYLEEAMSAASVRTPLSSREKLEDALKRIREKRGGSPARPGGSAEMDEEGIPQPPNKRTKL